MHAEHFAELTTWQRRQLQAWEFVGRTDHEVQACTHLLHSTAPSATAGMGLSGDEAPEQQEGMEVHVHRWREAIRRLRDPWSGEGTPSEAEVLEASCPSLNQVLDALVEAGAKGRQGRMNVLVTGSLYLVGDVLAQLQERGIIQQ